jgi:hypothetical protein
MTIMTPTPVKNPEESPQKASSSTATDINDPTTPKKLPKGVVLGKDGKPYAQLSPLNSSQLI